MSDKTRAAIPVAIGAMAIAMALGSMEQPVVVEINKQPTPYSADHSRVQAGSQPAGEDAPTF